MRRGVGTGAGARPGGGGSAGRWSSGGKQAVQLLQQGGAEAEAVGLARAQGVCHRDLKLENTLLDGRPAPRLKICDFGYSKVLPAARAAVVGWRLWAAPAPAAGREGLGWQQRRAARPRAPPPPPACAVCGV